jgi:hypothetical protein
LARRDDFAADAALVQGEASSDRLGIQAWTRSLDPLGLPVPEQQPLEFGTRR